MPKNTVPIPQNIIYEQITEINSGIGSVDQFVEESININTMHGELDSGYYRIIKPMKIDFTYIDVITEFDIVTFCKYVDGVRNEEE